MDHLAIIQLHWKELDELMENECLKLKMNKKERTSFKKTVLQTVYQIKKNKTRIELKDKIEKRDEENKKEIIDTW